MNDYATHAGGFASLKARLGADCPTFIWNNITIPMVPGSLTKSKDLGPGGFRVRSDMSFQVLMSDLPVPGPKLKQTISYLSHEYRIDAHNVLPGNLMTSFEVNDADAAA